MSVVNKQMFLILFILFCQVALSQSSLEIKKYDLKNATILSQIESLVSKIEVTKINDSMTKEEMRFQMQRLKKVDSLQYYRIKNSIKSIDKSSIQKIELYQKQIDSLRQEAHGYPVYGAFRDTLFLIYAKFGVLNAKERAQAITKKINHLKSLDHYDDSLLIIAYSELSVDILYNDEIIKSVNETDAFWMNTDRIKLAQLHKEKISRSIKSYHFETSTEKIWARIAYLIVTIIATVLSIWLISLLFQNLSSFLQTRRPKWLKSIKIRNYTFLNEEEEILIIINLLAKIRVILNFIILYFSLPVILSFFPASKSWSNQMFLWLYNPMQEGLITIKNYLPKLWKLILIIVVYRFILKRIKYIFKEIQEERLHIKGFYADWGMPTYNIVRFFMFAFLMVVIFPLLPGSDSVIFKGISVFVGVLLSFGSSSAVSNIIAGLVLTYMRPFQIGDRVKIAEKQGDVVEKSLLATRIKTPKNEEITIPNTAILQAEIINYSTLSKNKGLIIHSTITIGYDVKWENIHEAFIQAALQTEGILSEPKPFVYHSELNDSYVSYQINGYSNLANEQQRIYSDLHRNIQDVCFAKGIEILSPSYHAIRDGNPLTIPNRNNEKPENA